MITKGSRLPTREGAAETADHVFRGKANEQIVVLRGSEQDLHDYVADAQAARRPYAIRHFKISPEHDITPEQETEAVALMAREFKFDSERCVVIRHRKKRSRKSASEYHLHVLVPEWNPVTRRVLGTKWDWARHEKCSRLLEESWGHGHISGRFNAPVLKALEAEGHPLTEALLALDGHDRPEATHPQHQVLELARRTEWTAGRVTEAVRDAHAMSASANEFCSILGEQGLRIVEGKKGARWVVEAPTSKGGWMHAGSVNRLLKADVGSTDKWMRGVTSTIENKKRRKGHGQDGETVGFEGLHRDAGGDERARDASDDGLEWDDTERLGSDARSGEGGLVDGLAGFGRGGRSGIGDHEDRSAAAGEQRASSDTRRAERSVGRTAQHKGRKTGPARPSQSGRGSGDRGSSRSGQAIPNQSKDSRGARLSRLIGAAGLQHRLGTPANLRRIEGWYVHIARPQPEPMIGACNRSISVVDDEITARKRKARFRILLLRKAYRLSAWLPEEAVLNIRRIDQDPEGMWVRLTLNSGTRLLDTGDRITVRGVVDDVAVDELAECVERRGWDRVEITGDPEFRMAMSRELMARGIEVLDCPLSRDEQAELRRQAGGFDWRQVDEPAHVPPAPTPAWAADAF